MRSIYDRPILAKEDITIKEALKLIDANTEGLLFIIDSDNHLIGTLSDGDIRRALLSGKNLNDSISDIYNKDPFYIKKDELDEEVIKKIMITKRYEIIPLVSSFHIIESYITWDDIISGERPSKQLKELDVPVVIMAGGKGTRMAPFTHVLPKPLIPIGDKTILEIIIEQFLKHKITSYYITINYKGEMIRAYFEGIQKDYKVYFLKEKDFFGTAGSLKLLPSEINGPIIVSNCDIIVKANFADIIEFHNESKATLTIVSSIQHHTIPYGVIHYKNGGIVTKIEEKPEYSMCVNTGVYVIDSELIDLIPENEVFHMTDLIYRLIKKNKKVVTYPVNENDFIDIGQWEEYRNALDKLKIGE